MVSPAAIPDKVLFRARDIISGMLSDWPNLLEAIVNKSVWVVIYDRRPRSQADARITRAPEVVAGENGCSPTALGSAGLRYGGGEGLVIASGILQLIRRMIGCHFVVSFSTTSLLTLWIMRSGWNPAVKRSIHGSRTRTGWQCAQVCGGVTARQAVTMNTGLRCSGYWAKLALVPCRAGQRRSFHVGRSVA